MDKSKILPFYMTYPLPLFAQEEDSMMRDLDYMQQLYPMEAKKYQKRIAQILDKLDYEGSLIYDEYPCKWQLYQLTDTIMRILKQEAEAQGEKITPEIEKYIQQLIQILLYVEIYRRRHKK